MSDSSSLVTNVDISDRFSISSSPNAKNRLMSVNIISEKAYEEQEEDAIDSKQL